MDEQRAEFWSKFDEFLFTKELKKYGAEYAAFSIWQAATQRQQERIAELEAQVQALSLDAERLDWLTFHLSGKALRDIGVIWSEHADARAAIDAAIAAGKGEG